MKVRIVHVAHTMSRILSEDNGRTQEHVPPPTHTTMSTSSRGVVTGHTNRKPPSCRGDTLVTVTPLHHVTTPSVT